MGIETANFISGLDKTWPTGLDPLNKGDDHMRLIKRVLKSAFPGVDGDGFKKAITATEDELNFSAGVTSGIQAQINTKAPIEVEDNLHAPPGTIMFFYQATPPLGWTQVTNDDNSMLRVVDVGGGTSGGTDSPIAVDFSHTHATGDHQLLEAEMPSHTHSFTFWNDVSQAGPVPGDTAQIQGAKVINSTPAGSDQVHNHGNTGSSGATFEPRYINVIQAVKD